MFTRKSIDINAQTCYVRSRSVFTPKK